MSGRHLPPVHVVAMGVSATGKTTVAQALAEELDLEMIEGDNFHSPANIAKMAEGVPLTDQDRLPWLRSLADLIEQRDAEETSTVLACSALRRSYRDVLRGASSNSGLFFVHLHADFAVLLDRMGHRTKHFMPASLLESQFETLEPLETDEPGALVDVTAPLDEVVAEAVRSVLAHAPR